MRMELLAMQNIHVREALMTWRPFLDSHIDMLAMFSPSSNLKNFGHKLFGKKFIHSKLRIFTR